MRPAKTQISLGIRPVWSEFFSLGIRPVWSESSLSAWRKVGFLATHWTHSEGSDKTGRMPRLIWVFVGRIATLLVLLWGGLYIEQFTWTKMHLQSHNWAAAWENLLCHMRTTKTQISLCIRAGFLMTSAPERSLFASVIRTFCSLALT